MCCLYFKNVRICDRRQLPSARIFGEGRIIGDRQLGVFAIFVSQMKLPEFDRFADRIRGRFAK
ncbi:hypothetical protein QT971_26430 [Microcoleus sp. herbarium19]|uniref:hypothetical protein n=1 Tax=unclassified Microcoleus TaxID=2642155 RepID=UPI002FD3DC1D